MIRSLTTLALSASMLALAGCGAQDQVTRAALATRSVSHIRTMSGGDDATLAHLGEAKISLIDGVNQSERAFGFVTQAKFEMGDDGKLSLSVYNCPKGRDVDAEHNVLTETSGDPTASPWAPGNEVFTDAKHLTRSAMNLTVMQTTKLSLVDLIKKAVYLRAGTPWYAIPQIYKGHQVVDIKIADGKGGSETLHLDARNGSQVN